MSIIDIIEDTTVDDPRFRIAVYAAGCPDKCPGCHNPESWGIYKGEKVRTERIMEKMLVGELTNVIFSGGDPMFQSEGFTKTVKVIKGKSQRTIWCHTGYKFEDLIKNPAQIVLLSYTDVLTDDRHEQTLRDKSLLLRGNSSQRLIDIRVSLSKKEIVTYKYNPFI